MAASSFCNAFSPLTRVHVLQSNAPQGGTSCSSLKAPSSTFACRLHNQCIKSTSVPFFGGSRPATTSAPVSWKEGTQRQKSSSAVHASTAKSNAGVSEEKGSDSANNKERLDGALSAYQEKKAEQFPEIEDITPAEALALNAESVVYVDGRSEEERATSKLPGAVTKEDFLKNPEQMAAGKDLVVTYCTLGMRGGRLAKEIKDGHPDLKVKNLAGALVAWVHAGGPLVDASGADTKTYHPFSQGVLDKYAPKENGYEGKM